MNKKIKAFAEESNSIEGIYELTEDCYNAHEQLLNLEEITVADISTFVWRCQPGATIRSAPGMNVMVGGHFPPEGGQEILYSLSYLLERVNQLPDIQDSWQLHLEYETLHPYMDCNGRSGRAIWAWMQINRAGSFGLDYKFLQAFYYQTLSRMGKS